jgi:type VI secretion system protein ImpC
MAKNTPAAAPQAAATTAEGTSSLLDQVVGTYTRKDPEQQKVDQAKSVIAAVIQQALTAKPGSVVATDIEKTIKLWQAEIDRKLSAQLNEIMHAPKFQKLEGTWRGLDYLVKSSETSVYLKLRVLNASKRTILKDLQSAIEFDQSKTFKLIYTSEYDQLGGTPYGMLVGDYEFSAHPEDMEFLQKMSGVAAAAHAPFVAAASPKMFDLQSYTELNQPRDLAKIFEGVDYTVWRSFRESMDSRYVALTMPRVLARLPYGDATCRVDEFNFEEGVDGTDHSKYCWMNAAWAYAARVTDAFAKDGWFHRTRGVESGGKVEGLPIHVIREGGGKAVKCPTEVLIPDRRENELSGLGFLPLLHCKNSDFAAFLGSSNAFKAPEYRGSAEATSNAKLNTNLSYIMSVSRFAHYLKVIARDRIGSMMDVVDMKIMLNNWINNYVCDPRTAGEEIRAKNPLSAANVEVEKDPRKPGWYRAVAHLQPHVQFEGLTASMRLVAELPRKPGG